MYKILIADDHAVVRRGLVQILQSSPDLAVKGEASNGQEVLSKVGQDHWDAVILDLSMPGISGLDILKQLKSRHPQLPVLILSVHPEDQYAMRVLKAGAAGYLTKESAPEELVQAVHKVCAGGKYVSGPLAEKLVQALGADLDQSPHEILSDREFEVLRLLAAGRTITEIASDLCLSVKTISTYRARILDQIP